MRDSKIRDKGLGIAAALWFGALVAAAPQYAKPSAADVPTFSKDVAPILYTHCTDCHRPGEIAPMSLMTYQDARPWARAIRDEVGDGTMPPWHAEAPHGTFLNERRLSDGEKDTLLKWAANGAPEGDPKDLPPLPTYADGWMIGTPDAIFEVDEPYTVPAEGIVQYEYLYVATNFKEPKWVQAIEVRPGARSVVHHALVFYRAVPDIERTPVLRPNVAQSRLPMPTARGQRPPRAGLPPQRLLATYAPGTNPQHAPEGTAFRLEPGGILELQMHYTTTGEATVDRTKIGLVFAKNPEGLREVRASHFLNATLQLPAGAADVAVDAELTFLQETTVWGLFPHTHLRGTKWRYVLEMPDGTRKIVLDVPRYNFNWQTYYLFTEPLQVPQGAKLVSTAWYDNSPANRSNPDPTVDVTWGDQTWEEMQYTGVLFSPAAKPSTTTTGKQ
jgi:hypothetical protein